MAEEQQTTACDVRERKWPRKGRDWVGYVLSTAGLAGSIPVAPGTWGSLLAALMVLGMWALGGGGLWWVLLIGALLAGAVNVRLGGWIECYFGRKDPGEVVIDEVSGQWLALAGFAMLTPWHVGIGFVLFRLFDITKPWPCRRLERLPRGWGILLDDVMAGVYANVVLQVLAWGWLGGSLIPGGAVGLVW